MTEPFTDTRGQNPLQRRIACSRCGAAFDCSLDGGCWCTAEPYRLPVPVVETDDCLCPACLRAAAGAQRA